MNKAKAVKNGTISVWLERDLAFSREICLCLRVFGYLVDIMLGENLSLWLDPESFVGFLCRFEDMVEILSKLCMGRERVYWQSLFKRHSRLEFGARLWTYGRWVFRAF